MSARDIQHQDDIDHQASTWLVRIEEDGPLDAAGLHDFEAWRAADPRHARTYGDMRKVWFGIPELAEFGSVAPQPVVMERYSPLRRSWRRAAYPAFGAIAASVLAFVAVPKLLRPWDTYETGLAQTRLVTLPDGSSVTLGAKSRISVR